MEEKGKDHPEDTTIDSLDCQPNTMTQRPSNFTNSAKKYSQPESDRPIMVTKELNYSTMHAAGIDNNDDCTTLNPTGLVEGPLNESTTPTKNESEKKINNHSAMRSTVGQRDIGVSLSLRGSLNDSYSRVLESGVRQYRHLNGTTAVGLLPNSIRSKNRTNLQGLDATQVKKMFTHEAGSFSNVGTSVAYPTIPRGAFMASLNNGSFGLFNNSPHGASKPIHSPSASGETSSLTDTSSGDEESEVINGNASGSSLRRRKPHQFVDSSDATITRMCESPLFSTRGSSRYPTTTKPRAEPATLGNNNNSSSSSNGNSSNNHQYQSSSAYSRGAECLKKGEFGRAVSEFSQAIKFASNDLKSYLGRARAFMKLQRYEPASEDFTRVIELTPGDCEIFQQRGYAYSEMGDVKRALLDYSRVIEMDCNHVKARIARGELYRKTNLTKALQDFGNAVAIDERCERGYQNRAEVYEEMGILDLAYKDFTRVIGLQMHTHQGIRKSSLLARAAISMKLAERQQKQMIQPEFMHQQSLMAIEEGRSPTSPSFVARRKRWKYQDESVIRYVRKAIDDYIVILKQIDPCCCETLQMRGRAYFRIGLYTNAGSDFTCALQYSKYQLFLNSQSAEKKELHEKNNESSSDKATITMHSQEKKKGWKGLKGLSKQTRQDMMLEYVTIRFWSALAFLKNDDISESLEELQAILKINSRLVLVLYYRAFIYFEMGKLKESIEDYSEILKRLKEEEIRMSGNVDADSTSTTASAPSAASLGNFSIFIPWKPNHHTVSGGNNSNNSNNNNNSNNSSSGHGSSRSSDREEAANEEEEMYYMCTTIPSLLLPPHATTAAASGGGGKNKHVCSGKHVGSTTSSKTSTGFSSSYSNSNNTNNYNNTNYNYSTDTGPSTGSSSSSTSSTSSSSSSSSSMGLMALRPSNGVKSAKIITGNGGGNGIGHGNGGCGSSSLGCILPSSASSTPSSLFGSLLPKTKLYEVYTRLARARVYMSLEQVQSAIDDYSAILEVCPGHYEATCEYNQANEMDNALQQAKIEEACQWLVDSARREEASCSSKAPLRITAQTEVLSPMPPVSSLKKKQKKKRKHEKKQKLIQEKQKEGITTQTLEMKYQEDRESRAMKREDKRYHSERRADIASDSATNCDVNAASMCENASAFFSSPETSGLGNEIHHVSSDSEVHQDRSENENKVHDGQPEHVDLRDHDENVLDLDIHVEEEEVSSKTPSMECSSSTDSETLLENASSENEIGDFDGGSRETTEISTIAVEEAAEATSPTKPSEVGKEILVDEKYLKKRKKQMDKLRSDLLSSIEQGNKDGIEEILQRITRKQMDENLAEEIADAKKCMKRIEAHATMQEEGSKAATSTISSVPSCMDESTLLKLDEKITRDVVPSTALDLVDVASSRCDGEDGMISVPATLRISTATVSTSTSKSIASSSPNVNMYELQEQIAYLKSVHKLALEEKNNEILFLKQQLNQSNHRPGKKEAVQLLSPPLPLPTGVNSGVGEPKADEVNFSLGSLRMIKWNSEWNVCQRFDRLLSWIGPTSESERQRSKVWGFLQQIISKNMNSVGILTGSYPLKTYLPNGDLDLSLFSYSAASRNSGEVVDNREEQAEEPWYLVLMQLLCRESSPLGATAAFREDLPASAVSSVSNTPVPASPPCSVRNVTFINAEVKVIQCTINNLAIDITYDQSHAFGSVLLLDEINKRVGKHHLFKRSLLLIKAWCAFESASISSRCLNTMNNASVNAEDRGASILGARHGALSTYALNVMVMSIFNLYAKELEHPLQALLYFFEVFGSFQWKQHCVSIYGPISLVDFKLVSPLDASEYLINEEDLSDLRSIEIDVIPKESPVGSSNPEVQTAITSMELRLKQHQSAPAKLKNASSDEHSLKKPLISPSVSMMGIGGVVPSNGGFKIRPCNVLDPLNSTNNVGRSLTLKNLTNLENVLVMGRRTFLEKIASYHDPSARCVNVNEVLKKSTLDVCLRKMTHGTEMDELFSFTWKTYGNGDGYRPDLLYHPRQTWHPSMALMASGIGTNATLTPFLPTVYPGYPKSGTVGEKKTNKKALKSSAPRSDVYESHLPLYKFV